ncbi:YdcH family protein [Kaistella sp.]|uniref:YdcH family protein n=1 Tax=Kaistella sp. TaxID=2782235 RepID=UPI0035A01A25
MENHNLTHEFPELEVKINELKLKDDVFKKLYVNYEEVNALIQHYEEGEQNHTTDEHLTDLRKKRVHLKDDLYSYLHQN